MIKRKVKTFDHLHAPTPVLMAWEFALQGKKYWEKKLKEAKRVL